MTSTGLDAVSRLLSDFLYGDLDKGWIYCTFRTTIDLLADLFRVILLVHEIEGHMKTQKFSLA